MFHNLLICTDLQDGLHRLVRFVPSLAATGIRRIVFFHSVSLKEDRGIPKIDQQALNLAREQLSVALQNVPEGVDVHVEIDSDRTVENILKTIKNHECDLVLLGTQNKTLLNEKVFGSTTAALVERITIPMLVMRPALISTYTNEELDLRCRHLLRYLLIAYDGSDSAKHLVRDISELARQRPKESLETCLLGWVIEHHGRFGVPQSETTESVQAELDSVKTELESLGLTVDTAVRNGDRLTEFMDLAMEQDVSAVAVTSPSVPRLLEWSRPNFANKLLRRSWHPVLFFPPERSR
ncbi:universal stress protein [Baaleninema simplex]|uniref:universal stress protein n=1 Tax=Baaleninema simplex TaxID=2862350 RepID=UPI000378BCDA|nr:universal stress protein [Baaleninema simplex]